MSLTDQQRRAALQMKAERVNTFDISMALGLPRSDLTRLFMMESLNKKVQPDDPGYADEHLELARNAEATRAALMWIEKMGQARWDERRKPNMG